MNSNFLRAAAALALSGLALSGTASADPCGMVPPVWVPDDGQRAIERVGAQRTYVMHRDGVETMVLRPGFEGKVDEFGMLIPFPSPPAMRKIDDQTFAHLEAAIDPPTMNVHIYDPRPRDLDMLASRSRAAPSVAAAEAGAREIEDSLGFNEVRVLREEAVGMYQVAVLEAGSPRALKRWMEDNEYRYPEGMDEVTWEYVDARWCFVAIKATVGQGPGVNPRPGMRGVDFALPAGATFDGHVQGMGFRFEVDEPVVPMRLSVFNGEDPRNVVYMLTDEPVQVAELDASLVVRQLSGEALHANLTEPLPVAYHNGGADEVAPDTLKALAAQRDPSAYNGVARDLVAGDLLASRAGALSLPFEEQEKELLAISESLGLRGPAVDALHGAVLAEARAVAVDGALDDLKEMHVTVLDGVFDGEVLASTNLHFRPYTMPERRNTPRADSIRPAGPSVSVPRYSAGIEAPEWWPF